MPQLTVALVPAPDQVVVRLTGDADLSTAPLVADALAQAAELQTRQVVVDLAGARFWDCSGLHVLADFTGELECGGRSCRLVGALPATRRLIAMANLAGDLLVDGPVAAAAELHVRTDRVPARRPVSGHHVPILGSRPLRAGASGR